MILAITAYSQIKRIEIMSLVVFSLINTNQMRKLLKTRNHLGVSS